MFGLCPTRKNQHSAKLWDCWEGWRPLARYLNHSIVRQRQMKSVIAWSSCEMFVARNSDRVVAKARRERSYPDYGCSPPLHRQYCYLNLVLNLIKVGYRESISCQKN